MVSKTNRHDIDFRLGVVNFRIGFKINRYNLYHIKCRNIHFDEADETKKV